MAVLSAFVRAVPLRGDAALRPLADRRRLTAGVGLGDHGPPGTGRRGRLSLEGMFPTVPDARCTPRQAWRTGWRVPVGTRSSCASTGARVILSSWRHGRESQSSCSARPVARSRAAVTSTSCTECLRAGVAGFESEASSSQSQSAMRTARTRPRLTWEAASISVRWCPSLAAAIVTHLVTHFMLRVLAIQAALASVDGKTTETHAEPSEDSCDDRESHAPALSRLAVSSEWARW
jgi:hypothetical protein